jgi:predicted house-cleaning noncanonical NTP pyrophosphatase (MazG superfamily)
MYYLEEVVPRRLEMTNKRNRLHPLLQPVYPILFLSKEKTFEIPAADLTIDQVGVKAFGLSSLPRAWTLPFIVVSSDMLFGYRNCNAQESAVLIRQWTMRIIQALLSVGVADNDSIIVRSSGCSEGLNERGKFCSVNGTLKNIFQPIYECLNKLANDVELRDQKIPLIIQKYILPISATGHLSNERRFSEECRDWLGAYENINNRSGNHFKINLRNWRKKIIVDNYMDKPLDCNISALVSAVLEIPATWGYQRKLRLHYEWVWDSQTIYIVQADQENESIGVDPTKVYDIKSPITSKFKPKCVKIINETDACRYGKINNVFTYMKLGLPVTPLYILDVQSIIDNIAAGIILPELEDDISELVKHPLVIRMDIDTNDIGSRQMLPRNEVRSLDSALKWLKEQSACIKSKTKDDVAFIFHNFVPVVSSAFAYAAPGQRKVLIEALWGLPEGLYYNAHDKYIVDTQTPKGKHLTSDDMIRFEVSEKPRFKRFFVSPDATGRWIPQILKPPYDWRGSIQDQEWAKEIALESRRIAEEEKRPLSIMWFVDVPLSVCGRPVFPWHHEIYDSRINSRTPTHRTKTPFDESLDIKTSADIDVLKKEVGKEHSRVRRIRIQPLEEMLLRNKDTLRTIGELARKIDAIILLEGGILSHAYYQLMQTNAVVEVLLPFEDFEDKQEFYKLVRDKVPSNIENGGEIVRKTLLSGDYFLEALREKLIEEAFETLDATDKDSIIGELADVGEVIDGILSLLNVSRDELKQRQDRKREKAGGFKEGVVLLETRNPFPTKNEDKHGTPLFEELDLIDNINSSPISMSRLVELSHDIQKWSDKREHQAASEVILHIVIPAVRNSWEANTAETVIDSDSGNIIRAKVTGKRLGARIEIELSIFTQLKQLKLF